MTIATPTVPQAPPPLPQIAGKTVEEMLGSLIVHVNDLNAYCVSLWEHLGTVRTFNAVTLDRLNNMLRSGTDITIEDLIVTLTTNLQGAVDCDTTLNVDGKITAGAAMDVTGLLQALGAMTVGTTLGVTGKLTASAAADVTGLLQALAALTVGTTLSVTGNTTLSAHLMPSNENGITASTTQTQAAGTAITKTISNVTVSGTDGDAITLPTGALGRTCILRNSDAAQTIQVFPASGGSINGGAVDASVTLAAGETGFFFDVGGAIWVMAIGA